MALKKMNSLKHTKKSQEVEFLLKAPINNTNSDVIISEYLSIVDKYFESEKFSQELIKQLEYIFRKNIGKSNLDTSTIIRITKDSIKQIEINNPDFTKDDNPIKNNFKNLLKALFPKNKILNDKNKDLDLVFIFKNRVLKFLDKNSQKEFLNKYGSLEVSKIIKILETMEDSKTSVKGKYIVCRNKREIGIEIPIEINELEKKFLIVGPFPKKHKKELFLLEIIFQLSNKKNNFCNKNKLINIIGLLKNEFTLEDILKQIEYFSLMNEGSLRKRIEYFSKKGYEYEIRKENNGNNLIKTKFNVIDLDNL